MTVVAIIGIVAALSARMYSRGVRGEGAPKFARSMMATMLDARHMALSLGRPTSVTLTGGAGGSVTTAAYDTTSAAWVTQTKVSVPSSLTFCVSDTSVSNLGSAVTPTCPLTGSNVMCFWPNGRASMLTSGSCSTTSPSSGTGGTVYLETYAGDKNYRIWVWGLTGMVKMIDQW